MTTYVLTYRLVKGSPLTEAEFDANVHNLDDRVTVVEASAVKSITDATIDGSGHLILTLSDSSTIDAGALPVAGSFADSFKGVWTPSTIYHVNDLFTAPGSNWLGAVIFDHTSDLTFSWSANDGMGHDFYAVVVPLGTSPIVAALADTDYTLVLDDAGHYIRSTGTATAGVVITIPANDTVPFPVDTEISFCQRGDQITFVTTSGVTLNYPLDANPTTALVGAVVTLKKVATDEWDLFGRLEQISV